MRSRKRVTKKPVQPTTWVWEGVVNVPGLRDIEASLQVVERRSAPRSRLVVAYHAPALILHVMGFMVEASAPFRSTFTAPAPARTPRRVPASPSSATRAWSRSGSSRGRSVARAAERLKHHRIATANRASSHAEAFPPDWQNRGRASEALSPSTRARFPSQAVACALLGTRRDPVLRARFYELFFADGGGDGRAWRLSIGPRRRSVPSRLAAEPEDVRPHRADVAPAHVRVVGRLAHQPLQRRLQSHRRRQAPGRSGSRRRRSGARSGTRSARAPSRDARQRGDLRRGAAAHHGAQRLPGGDLLHVLLQPGPERPGRHRRHPLREHRRHRTHHRRAPARHAARARRARRPTRERRGGLLPRGAPASRPTRATCPSRSSTCSSRRTRA